MKLRLNLRQYILRNRVRNFLRLNGEKFAKLILPRSSIIFCHSNSLMRVSLGSQFALRSRAMFPVPWRFPRKKNYAQISFQAPAVGSHLSPPDRLGLRAPCSVALELERLNPQSIVFPFSTRPTVHFGKW